jgi:DNA-binding response OmpR family regulator
VARILICEPHADIRTMLSFVVRRLGHEPLVSDGSHDQLFGVDAVVVEPGCAESLATAEWTREHAPDVAIVCTSIYPASHKSVTLKPDAYLVKPFPLYELENALSSALGQRGERRALALEQV